MILRQMAPPSKLRNALSPDILESCWDKEGVRLSSRRMRSGPNCCNARRSSRFLRFVVEQAIECHAESVREQVLGREVFDRDESFDPSIDPIVRVEASRLRSKLQRYFRNEGRSDSVLIQLKKGGYIPWFRRRMTLA